MEQKGNEEQQKAILHFKGPCMVVAPPGSGKTFTMIQRICYLLKERKIPPEEILVITFSKAAAQEMQMRFCKEYTDRKVPVTFGTFHAIYYHIMKQSCLGQKPSMISPIEKRELLKIILEETLPNQQQSEEFLELLLEEIGKAKNHIITPERYDSQMVEESLFVLIYESYCKEMKQRNKIDFDDMMIQCYQLLMSRADILEKWQNQYRFLLIDEFQDINELQFEVVKLLVKKEENLFVVGDDDQSIYGFRGANPQIMLQFKEYFPNVVQILLTKNYRSTETIVRAAKEMIQCNSKRFSKEIQAHQTGGEAIVCHGFETKEEETANMVSFFESYCKIDKTASYSDIAVIFRTNRGSAYLLEELSKHKIPFITKEKCTSFYQHFAIKDIFAYLKFVFAGANRGDFLTIMNRPKRYISRSSLCSKVVLLDDLKDYYKENHRMCGKLNELEYQLTLLKTMTLYAAINYIRKGMGYDEYLKNRSKEQACDAREWIKLLDELQMRAKGKDNLEEWLLQIESYEEEISHNKQEGEKEGILILTMHASKGLEFKIVIIPDLNEGVMPHPKARSEDEIEEERRLCYVALTRAKSRLFLFYVKKNQDISQEISRFIRELKQ